MSLVSVLALCGALSLVAARALAQNANTVSGTVVSATGRPVRGAEVIVATPDKWAYPNIPPEEREEAKRGAKTAMTDAMGHFSVELPPGAGVVSINHPTAGYAEVKPQSLAENAPVTLEPWCKVEGTFKIGAKPAPAGSKVSLGVIGSNAGVSRVMYAYSTTTDATGHYLLDHVPAGLNQIKVRATDKASPLDQYVGCAPDKPVRFDIGGKGRPVIGKLVLGGAYDLKNLSPTADPSVRLNTQSHFRRDVPWPSPPAGSVGGSREEREDVAREWRKTQEAVDQFKDQYRCNVEFQPDGSFRFDDVPPGKYLLTLILYQQSGPSVSSQPKEVVVPEDPACPTDLPLDIGELKVGGDAPAAPAAGQKPTDGL